MDGARWASVSKSRSPISTFWLTKIVRMKYASSHDLVTVYKFAQKTRNDPRKGPKRQEVDRRTLGWAVRAEFLYLS